MNTKARRCVKLAATFTRLPMVKTWLESDSSGSFETLAAHLLDQDFTMEQSAIRVAMAALDAVASHVNK